MRRFPPRFRQVVVFSTKSLSILLVIGGLVRTACAQQRFALGTHNGAVTAVAFSPDGAYFATGGADGIIKVWSLDTRQVAFSLPNPKLSQDRLNVVVKPPPPGVSREDWMKQQAATSPLGAIDALTFSADGQKLTSSDPKQRMVEWSVAEGRAKLSNVGEGVTLCVANSPDGIRQAWGRADGAVASGKLSSHGGAIILHAHTSRVMGVFWEADSLHYLSADFDGNWKRWFVKPDSTLSKPAPPDGLLPPGNHTVGGSCALSADHHVLAVLHPVENVARVGLYKFPSGEPISEVLDDKFSQGQGATLVCVALSADGLTVSAGASNGKAYFWDTSPQLVAAKVIAGPVVNPLMNATAGDKWPPLTKRLEGGYGSYPNVHNLLRFIVTSPEVLVIGIRRVENGKISTAGYDARMSDRIHISGSRMELPEGDYVLFWRKLTEPGVVHQMEKTISLRYSEQTTNLPPGVEMRTRWQNFTVTLDGSTAKAGVTPESSPGSNIEIGPASEVLPDGTRIYNHRR